MTAYRHQWGLARWSVLLLAGSTLLGCATSGEKQARADWDQIQRTRYAVAPDTTTATTADPLPDLERAADLTDLVRYAEMRDPGLRANFHRWQAALERIPQARALPDPRLSYAYFVQPIETRVGPLRQRVELAQTLPFFGKLGLRGQIALQEANAARARYEAARLRLTLRLAEGWHDYYYLGQSIAVTEENVQLMTQLERVARSRYTAGSMGHADVIRVQVELDRLQDRLASLRDRQRPLLARLNALLDRPAGAPIAWPTDIEDAIVSQTPDELARLMNDHNPDLLAIEFVADREQARADLAGRSAIPDLTLAGEYTDIGDAIAPIPESGQDAFAAKASITLPLWFGKYRAEKREASARQAAAVDRQDAERRDLLARLETTLFELRDAERRITLYDETVLPKARRSLEVMEDAFGAGSVGFLDLVDAQRTLLEFELSSARARADRATRVVELSTVVGIDLTQSEEGTP